MSTEHDAEMARRGEFLLRSLRELKQHIEESPWGRIRVTQAEIEKATGFGDSTLLRPAESALDTVQVFLGNLEVSMGELSTYLPKAIEEVRELYDLE
ncbi:MAG: hypothetical protein ABIK89_13165 [Planctomycetota bacterium]